MAYLVLARKYRPKNFDSVVHQEHVTTTLKNAIVMDRVAHAHIFTGPRGTGKTTIARILAKCMNCSQGPTENPCENCRSCKEIISGNPSDIIEVDGASNNSVDQIREIRDNLQYKPSHSKFKIYIIDEVHMLSTAAFNALLKSLEEPPSHIMFFFATTEPHKVPVTIMSRCQRHDLKRVPVNILADHLKNICEKENISAGENGLINIAAAAEGSVRDAMSTLDQVISSSSSTDISEKHINWILGSTPFPLIKDTLISLLNGKAEKLIESTSRLYFSGTDLKIFYKKIIEYFRHLILIKLEGENGNLCDLPENQKKELFEAAEEFSFEHLTRLLDILMKEELRVRQTDNIRILLELIFIKITQIPKTESLSKLVDRLDSLELGNIDTSGLVITRPDTKTDSEPQTEIDKELKSESLPLPADAEPEILTAGQPEKKSLVNETENNEPEKTGQETPEPDISGDIELKKYEEIKESQTENINTDSQTELSDPDKWKACVKAIQLNTPSIGNLLETRADFQSLSNGELSIQVKGSKYHISKLKNDKTKTRIEKTASEIFGTEITINLLESVSDSLKDENGRNKKEKLMAEIMVNPLVLSIKDRLKAKIIEERIFEDSEKEEKQKLKEE